MNHKPVMQAMAVISALIGVFLLFDPNAMMAMYKAPPMNGTGVYNSMLYGGALVGFGVATWVAASDTLEGARHLILGTLIGNTLGLLVALARQLTDANIPLMAWGNVLLFLVFTVLYARLYAAVRAGSPRAQAAPAG